MNILFYDATTPVAYTFSTLQQQALGGTEATIIRIAHALAAFHTVTVAQHNRFEDCEENNVRYVSLKTAHQLNPNAVILLRSYDLLSEIGTRYQNARLFFWVHNTPSNEFFRVKPVLLQFGYQIITVSNYHRQSVEEKLKGKWHQQLLSTKKSKTTVPVHTLYNPIADDLNPDETTFNHNKLLFLSSPHKGLKETLAAFKQVLNHFPDFRLSISNPGYRQMTYSLPEQARFLGVLRHQEVIQQLRESFCVFYPQTSKPETFGLIYAEANAVGTPVLANHFGAAKEVLSHSTQLINGKKIDHIIAKLHEWKKQRPQVYGKPEFRLRCVTQQWLQLLEKQ